MSKNVSKLFQLKETPHERKAQEQENMEKENDSNKIKMKKNATNSFKIKKQ